MKLKKGDQILIAKGKDKGKSGKISRVLPKENKILVEGLNLKKKHVRPKKSGEKGKIVALASFFSAANARLICPKCKKATRIGYQMIDKIKKKICKKCNTEI